MVFDVGANNGEWSSSDWPGIAKEMRASGKQFDLLIVEPQPQFAQTLQAISDANNFTYVGAAAWKQNTTLYFDVALNSGDGSKSATISSDVPPSMRSKRMAVPAIDLAELMRSRLPDPADRVSTTLSFLKLDVEGAEFELLPWLLLQDALCRVDYFLVEWHLNRVSPAKRLAALSLRHSLYSLLETGCRQPPRAVLNDVFKANNYAVPVPGLHELAQAHSVCMSTSISSWTRGLLESDIQALRLRKRARLGEQELRQRNNNSRPRCFGRCEEVAMEYEDHFVERSWNRAAGPSNDPAGCVTLAAEWLGSELY